MPSKARPDGEPLPQSLEALRREIDRLDDALLALVERRLAASATIAALKEAESGRYLKLRPRREKMVIERLVARAELAHPELVAQLWRSLMAYGLQAQMPTELIMCAVRDPAGLEEKARLRFGTAAKIRHVNSPAEALAAAAEGEAIALIEQGLSFTLPDNGDLLLFDNLCDSTGNVVAAAIGRVAPDEIIIECPSHDEAAQ